MLLVCAQEWLLSGHEVCSSNLLVAGLFLWCLIPPPCPCSKETCYLVHLGHWFTIPLGFTWPYLFILFRDWSRESSGLYHRRTWTVPKSGFRAFWTASACLAGQPKNHSWHPVVPKRSKFKDKRWLRDDKSDKQIKRQRLDAARDETESKWCKKHW